MVTITIGGIDRTQSVEFASMRLTRAITSQVDTLQFQVVRKGGVASGGYKPHVLDTVFINDGAMSIFGGQIVEIDEGVEGADLEIFSCQAKDFSYDMDRRLVVGNYTNMTVGAIIQSIVTNFLPAGYTTTHVNSTVIASYVAFNYEYPSKVFQQLAQLANCDWYVDQNKNIWFFPKATVPAPFSLTDTSGNYYYSTLELQNDLTNLRNTIIVRGGQYVGSLSYEQGKADGIALTYTQGNQYTNVYVKVNGTLKTLGIDNIDSPALFDVLYNFQQKFVRFKVTTLPAAGDVIEVGGNPYIPVIVKYRDVTSIAKYGVYEFKIVDKSINSKEGARDRAKAELAAWSNIVEDGTFETMTPGLDVGQELQVQSDIRGINTTYVISRIQSTLVNGQQFNHKVTLVTSRSWGMIEFLMQLLMSKDKEIEINPNEVIDEVEAADEEIVITESISVAITHNPQLETVHATESAIVRALNFATIFVLGTGIATVNLSTVTTVASGVLNYLLVAGGASAGTSTGGGGGAGGVKPGTSTVVVGTYPIVVGAGGAARVSTQVTGLNGADTTFNGLTAVGGGAGGGGGNDTGKDGGSGGGGGGGNGGVTKTGGNPTAGQGSAGGTSSGTGPAYGGAGGGGAGGAGSNGTSSTFGAGGAGLSNSISGSPVVYGKGGDGGRFDIGGGGVAGVNPGDGGSGANDSTVPSGAGANGIAIISYPIGSITATGGTMTTAGGNTIHTFTTNGSFVVTAVVTSSTVTGTQDVGIGTYPITLTAGQTETVTYPTGSLIATGGVITVLGGNTIHTFSSSGTFTVLSVTDPQAIPTAFQREFTLDSSPLA